MDSAARTSLKTLILGTKLGRMCLFAGFLLTLLLAVPYGCARRAKPPGPVDPRAESAAEGKKEELPLSPKGFDDTLTLGEKYDALIRRWGTDLAHTKGDLDSTRKELENLRNALAQERTEAAAGKKELSETLRRLEQGVGRDLGLPPRPEPAKPEVLPQGELPPHALRTIAFTPGSPRAMKNKRSVHVPAATGGLATLLNGVFAPISGEPSPVRLRFDAALQGPNRSRLGLRDAYLIGKAQGDANSSRVTIQVDRLSYVAHDGRSIESRVLGYVVGEDGLEGVPGSYEWRASQLLPLSLAASGLSAGTEGLALGETTTTVNPLGGASSLVTGDALKFAGFRAASGAAGKTAEILSERMREIRPAVSVPSGREVTVVFLEGVTLEGLEVETLAQARDHDPFRGLDIHR